MGRFSHAALMGAFAFLFAARAQAQDSLPADTVQRLKDSTVYIKTAIGPVKMTGSGFVIQITGDTALIATNHHVITPPRELQVGGFIPGLRGRDRMYLHRLQQGLAGTDVAVTVVFNSGDAKEQALKAEILGGLEEPDLAIMKVTGIKIPPKAIGFGDSPAPIETMPVFVLGFPFGDALATNQGNPSITIGKGSVSSIRKDASGKTAKIQIDGALNPGNSGGPVVDSKGNLVGISVQTIQGSNIGLAIPPAELVGTLEGRLGKPVVTVGPVVNDALPTYEVLVPVIDPLKKLKSAAVQFVDGAVSIDASKSGQPQLNAAPGSQTAELAISGREARAKLALPVGSKPQARDVTVQASYVNQQGKMVFLDPVVVKVAAPAVITTKTDGGSVTVSGTQKTSKGTVRREVTITRGNSSGKSKFDERGEDESTGSDDAKTSQKGKASAKDTAKAGKGKKESGTGLEVTWTNKITTMKRIPDDEVTGEIDGLEFTLDKAELKGGNLELRQGTGFFPELAVSLAMFIKPKEDLSGRKIVVNGSVSAGEPHARLQVMRKGEKLPKTQPYLEYLMVLEFGDYDAESRMQPGKIYICFPDRAKSFLAGSFEARVD